MHITRGTGWYQDQIIQHLMSSVDEGYMGITVWSYVEDRCVPHLSVDFSDEQVGVQIH